jgi:hypothetical protein
MRGSAFDDLATIVTELAGCLCSFMNDAGQTQPCSCTVMEGTVALNDNFGDCNGKDGLAFVRLATTYPAVNSGEVATEKRNLRLGLGFDIEIGVERTMLMDDRDATLAEVDVIVGAWTPRGPQGGIYGGSVTIYGLLT